MLASAAHVAIEDQILLIGPPYKPLKRLDPPLVFSSSSATDEEAAQAEQQQQQQHLSSSSTSTYGSSSSSSSSITASFSSSATPSPTRSIYLYNRRTLDAPSPLPSSSSSSTTTDPSTPLPVLLPDLPLTPPHPTPPWLQHLLNQAAGGGPLSQALSQYERLVSLNLAKGHTYVQRAQLLLEASVRCLEEQRVQRDAGQVALTNLCDHFSTIARDARELRRRYGKQAEKHESLLENFNDNLRGLEKRKLHPALGKALREAVREGGRGGFAAGGGGEGGGGGGSSTLSSSPLGGGSSGSSSSSSGSSRDFSLPTAGLECEAIRKATLAAAAASSSSSSSPPSLPSSSSALEITLLDCVPVGRVTDWYRECRDTRERLSRWMDELNLSLKRLEEGVEAQRGGREGGRAGGRLEVDLGKVAQEDVEALTRQLTEQEKAVALLERGHQEMLDRIRTSYGEGGGEGGGGASSFPPSASAKVVGTCQWLEGVLTRQAGVMASLEGIDHDMVLHMKGLAQQKQGTGRWLRSHLSAISRLQGDIQTLRQNLSIGKGGREGGREGGRKGECTCV